MSKRGSGSSTGSCLTFRFRILSPHEDCRGDICLRLRLRLRLLTGLALFQPYVTCVHSSPSTSLSAFCAPCAVHSSLRASGTALCTHITTRKRSFSGNPCLCRHQPPGSRIALHIGCIVAARPSRTSHSFLPLSRHSSAGLVSRPSNCSTADQPPTLCNLPPPAQALLPFRSALAWLHRLP